ncbi:MAG: HAMP domain-containing histidine kinase [Gammaproteobacteria bacterium]|nr:HAMP domain-containing histidine kinase [Gammaproteobacteria bacterium]
MNSNADPEQQGIPFSTILASTVHDMKNALSLIMQSLSNLTDKLAEVDPDNTKVPLLQYETSRVNSLLVQLLALYKAENKQLPLNINYHNVYDFLEEQALFHDHLLSSKNITISIDADDELEWAFDEALLTLVITNIISNSIRYTNRHIHLNAVIVADMLELKVSDDGNGYPKKMIEQQNDVILGINQSTGSTGLGLYFAGQVASMHKNTIQSGQIKLSNGENTGGVFSIRIP